MADKKKKPAEAKKAYSRRAHYKVEGDKVVRGRTDCPKCGPGFFLAEHKNRVSCGRCGHVQMKAPPDAKAEGKPAKAPQAA